MPVIYLRHPIHGSKVATLDMEAEYDEMNGWRRYTPDEPAPSEPEIEDPAPIVRRGRRKRVDDPAQLSEEI